MSWLKGVKDAANTSKYKGYATGGGVKPETVSADPTSTKVAGPKAAPFVKPMGGAAKPVFGKAGKKAFKTGGAVKKRADGGETTTKTSGEEVDERPDPVSDYLSDKARDRKGGSTAAGATGLGSMASGLGFTLAGSRRLGPGMLATGAGLTAMGLHGASRARDAEAAANKMKTMDLPGRPEHKAGGKVSKKACGGSSGGERRLKAQDEKEPL